MTFEEYMDTDVFRRERERLCANKRTAKRRMIFFLVGLALLFVGGILLPEEKESELLWRGISGGILFGAGMIVIVIGAILSRRTDDRREDSMMRRPAFAAAFLLYARQYLVAGWRAENGVVAWDIDLPAGADKKIAAFALVRGGQRTEISFAPFGEYLDALDAVVLVAFGLFSWLERENVSAARIACRLLEEGVTNGKKEEIVLYTAGKWKFTGRMLRREYRRIAKYARKRGLIE